DEDVLLAEVEERELAEEVVADAEHVAREAGRDVAALCRPGRRRVGAGAGTAEDERLPRVVDVPSLEERQASIEVITCRVGMEEDGPGPVRAHGCPFSLPDQAADFGGAPRRGYCDEI